MKGNEQYWFLLRMKVSIITPVFNARQFLEETFSSVYQQSIGFDNIEWILVDDCSTDGSKEIINQWAKKYKNIVTYQTPTNSGAPAFPRNIGLDHASSKYLMFLDNDDCLTPGACEDLYTAIESSNSDIVSGDAVLLNAKSFTKEEKEKLILNTSNYPTTTISLSLPFNESINPFINNHWCKIYKRDIVEKNSIRCLNGELWEDILFLFLYLSCAETAHHIQKPIIQYRVRKDSLSREISKKLLCSLPKSTDFGMTKAEALGKENAQKYVALLEASNHIEYYLDQMLRSESLSTEDLNECLLCWKNAFMYSTLYGLSFHSAYSKILADDFSNGDDEKALFHFHTLRELYKQREKEKNDILNSKSFRLAQMIRQFLHHK